MRQHRGAQDVQSHPSGLSDSNGHGFMNDHDPKDQTLMLRFLARISRTEYDEAATRDARRRIIEFFNRYLKSTG